MASLMQLITYGFVYSRRIMEVVQSTLYSHAKEAADQQMKEWRVGK